MVETGVSDKPLYLSPGSRSYFPVVPWDRRPHRPNPDLTTRFNQVLNRFNPVSRSWVPSKEDEVNTLITGGLYKGEVRGLIVTMKDVVFSKVSTLIQFLKLYSLRGPNRDTRDLH